MPSPSAALKSRNCQVRGSNRRNSRVLSRLEESNDVESIETKDVGQRKDRFFYGLFHYGSAIAGLDRSRDNQCHGQIACESRRRRAARLSTLAPPDAQPMIRSASFLACRSNRANRSES